MVRTLIAVLVLIGAVLWTPIWFQIALFVFAIVLIPYTLALLFPAIVSDVLYAPTDSLKLGNLTMTLIVVAMVVVWTIIMQQTRISHVVPTK